MVKPYYDHAGIQIYHGDCREILAGLEFDAIVSDPPYGMDYCHGARRGGVLQGHDGKSIFGDQSPFDPSHLPVQGLTKTILWGGNHFANKLPASKGWLVWHKRHEGESNDQSDCELAWTNFMTVARVFRQRWNGANRQGREQTEDRLHVNQKPVSVMDWCISLLGPVESVCDPYCGSGTTLVAAKERGLRAIGIEIEEKYAEIAARRLAQEVFDFA